MRYYNNLDIMPVYQSLNLIMMMTCGWILLDEIKYYDMGNILGIVGSVLLIIAGIKIITMKTSVIAQAKRARKRTSDELSEAIETERERYDSLPDFENDAGKTSNQ